MIFSELYSAYYNTVSAILKAAVKHPVNDDELHRIVNKHAFGESVLTIIPALKEERWQLLRSDGTTPIKSAPSMPLTDLEKSWLNAVADDPRIRLFTDEPLTFPDVKPLFSPEDIFVFGKYSDGDNYRDETYIRNFRLILSAIKTKHPLKVSMENRKGHEITMLLMPKYLEYSEKDDKFRLIGTGSRLGNTVNLGRLTSCELYDGSLKNDLKTGIITRPRSVCFEVVDERKALERVLMHFAHFKKQAEKICEDKYRITVFYDKDDETEMVIRILAFGPMVRVIAPEHFVGLIKKRLIAQKSCGQ